jgi:hypothetical protein
MQRCTCTVQLAGDMRNTVVKHGVSPAEVVILRAIHGEEAVTAFLPDGNDRGRAVDEKGRLSRIYKDNYKLVFPGAVAALPETFAAIGVDLYADEVSNTDEAPKRRGRPPNVVATKPAVITAADLQAADAEAE